MNTYVPYQRLREILSNEFVRLKKEGQVNLKDIAPQKLGIKESRLASWRAGQRAPSEKECLALAKALRPENVAEQNSLFEQLKRSIMKGKTSPSHVLEEIASGNRPLRFGSTSYSGGDAFLDLFFRRFLHVAGLEGKEVDWNEEAISLKDQLLQDDPSGVDVGLGLFAEINRAIAIRFISTPIRVGINAVVLDDSVKRRSLTPEQLRDALTHDGNEFQQKLLPIVMESEVGGLYITRMLRFKKPLVDFVKKFQPELYGRQLIARERKFNGDPAARVPVVVVDEVTALYILRYLEQQNQAAHLVFSLDDSESVKIEKQILPEFLVSMSVNRKHRELVDYLLDAMRLFLRTEIETISMYYVQFFRELENLAADVGPATSLSTLATSSQVKRQAARRWAEYTFGLPSAYFSPQHQDDFELPWSVILSRANSILNPPRL